MAEGARAFAGQVHASTLGEGANGWRPVPCQGWEGHRTRGVLPLCLALCSKRHLKDLI